MATADLLGAGKIEEQQVPKMQTSGGLIFRPALSPPRRSTPKFTNLPLGLDNGSASAHHAAFCAHGVQ